MKHVRTFSQLFESVSATPDAIKNLSGYKKLLDQGWIDITTPIMAKNGTVKFDHPDTDQYTSIHSNGYIRGQGKHAHVAYQRISPLHPEKPANAIFGRPIEKIEDYDIKFKWLENYWINKVLKESGVSPSERKKVIQNQANDLSRIINDMVEKDADAIPSKTLERLKKTGLLDPNRHTGIIMDLGDLGLF
jgi:hypothetical protein